MHSLKIQLRLFRLSILTRISLYTLVFVTSLFICVHSFAQQAIPMLVKKNNAVQLHVEGKPFYVLGGELGNSSASSMAYMEPCWSKLTATGLNTILSPVYWELIEPEEGKFDFGIVDSFINAARDHQLKVILLWFGSWKNSMSCYVPAWVKTNQKRFPRAVNNAGRTVEILSAFSQENLTADCKAFAALMKHIKETDKAQTVIMVQVENEIGMLGAAREKTAAADAAFSAPVPKELINYLVKKKDSLVPELKEHWSKTNFAISGNWEAVFGKSLTTDEIFQAWYYAKYTNTVAEAGKKVYPLPMYVNVALNHRNVLPGEYPSAGPLPQIMDIWQAAAPMIDILSPDFYNPRFAYYCDLFTRRNNPLFIPEIWMRPSDAAKVIYALGHYQGIGFSPFSIENAQAAEGESLAKSYAVLSQLFPLLAKHSGDGTMDGVLLDTLNKKTDMTFGDYHLTVSHDYTLGWSPEASGKNWPESGAIIIQEGPGEFLVAGTGVVITFKPEKDSTKSAGILQADEGVFEKGIWKPGRRMNGDQDHQGRHIRIPVGEWGVQRVKMYLY